MGTLLLSEDYKLCQSYAWQVIDSSDNHCPPSWQTDAKAVHVYLQVVANQQLYSLDRTHYRLEWIILVDDVFLQKKHDEPVHIVNVAIRYDTQEEDDTYAAAFEEFCAEKVRNCAWHYMRHNG